MAKSFDVSKDMASQIAREEILRTLGLARERLLGLLDGLEAEIRDPDPRAVTSGSAPAAARHGAGTAASADWTLGDAPLEGEWRLVAETEDETYRWPDENVDEYERFATYEGTGDFDGMRLALGFKFDGDIVGFVLGGEGGSKRGLTYFFPTDDFWETNELISMIRGGGPRGRGGFAPDDATPPAYAGFKIDVLADRRVGKWRVQGVVADLADAETMLRHTALQARLRGLA